ncbi:toxic anion resistance protein [Clostridium estertheticum]|uniref:toxic anion resistance protein n=1 Tax=Clostridium estertheticum TaxID=238834 RepID=UPI001CF4F72A|nr:toxic anion resistance protein [Clostridium estertheticum]MCB2360446.1 toxic anion resistance protein [Clostridium estertheticum]
MEKVDQVLTIEDESIGNDLIEKKAISISEQLKTSPEVIQIASKINIKDANAVLEFGNEPALQISKFADQILNSIKTNSIENSGVMIKELTSIMKKFDKQDFEEEKTGFFAKIFSKPSQAIDKMMGKYKTIGGEIDKIYTQLSVYKREINSSNLLLENLYNQNFEYYGELEKYITAGNMVVQKYESDDIPKLESLAANGEQINVINYQNAKETVEMLKQRIYDLEMAKMVSLQTAPQIKMIQRGNYKLISKVHSAFIITIPVFKNGIIQAIALKKQRLVSDSLAELDRTTNELLMKNAENIRMQSVDIAKLAGGTSVKIETLEKTWNTIMQGIEETKSIEDENKKLREVGIVKIHEMTEKIKQKSLS